MPANFPNGPDCWKCSLNIEWHDCSFCPAITLRSGLELRRGAATKPLPGASILPHPLRRQNLFQPMKKIGSLKSKTRTARGFTLTELLVVISIIGILAAMLMPALQRAIIAAQKTKAKTQMADLVNSINAYDMDYGRFPVSTNAQNTATLAGGDFTYGGTFNGVPVPTVIGGGFVQLNAEVMAILMDITNITVTTVNQNHQKNPKQVKYLNAKLSGDPGTGSQPLGGVDNAGIYRDPWGNPYVITMDLNYNDFCEDTFYCLQNVSGGGIYGLIQQGANGSDHWAVRGKVMVWSAGPDGKIDNSTKANQSVNKDNVLSWQQ